MKRTQPSRLLGAGPTLLLALVPALTASARDAARPGLDHTMVRPPRQRLTNQHVVVLERGAKVCQLIGDFDRELQQPTTNATGTRFGLVATDLGVSFEHAGKLLTVFGDSFGVYPGARDAIAASDDRDPTDCLDLEIMHDAAGTWRPITIPGIAQGGFNVPLDGTSLFGRLYLYHTTDAWFDAFGSAHMGRSVLAVSHDDGWTFSLLYTVSSSHFINVSVVEVQAASWPGLPAADDAVLLFGSGDYRRSSVRLACQPDAGIESATSLRFFAGLDEDARPRWSAAETDAAELFDDPCVGELSVTYDTTLKAWLIAYNCSGRIVLRTAAAPWGPWTEAQTLFDPWGDGGYCHFMHVSWRALVCDQVHDVGKENVWGGAYGPYFVERFAAGDERGRVVYFTLSTWNPYTVVLMRAKVARAVRSRVSTP